MTTGEIAGDIGDHLLIQSPVSLGVARQDVISIKIDRIGVGRAHQAIGHRRGESQQISGDNVGQPHAAIFPQHAREGQRAEGRQLHLAVEVINHGGFPDHPHDFASEVYEIPAKDLGGGGAERNADIAVG